MTTGKTIALTTQIFVGNVMSLLFNTLPRFVTAFLPRSKRHLILWLQLSSTVILEPKKIKSVSVSTFPPSICHEVMGLDVMILVHPYLCRISGIFFFFLAGPSLLTLFLELRKKQIGVYCLPQAFA